MFATPEEAAARARRLNDREQHHWNIYTVLTQRAAGDN
jgi:hypothetical protein